MRAVSLLLLLACVFQGATADKAAQRRCAGAIGDWCEPYDAQPEESHKPPPRGDKRCPKQCNLVGNCNADTGLCECPAGWQGDDCMTPLKRPCTNRFRGPGEDVVGHIDADGRDLNPLAEGFTESRCIGICDDDIGRCFCDGAYAPIKAPKGSPPGTPWIYRGRPLGNHLCQPNDDGKGNPLPWGQVPWKSLYGAQGWCNAPQPEMHCGCMYEGFGGHLCDQVTEHMCPNQCSGHGNCYLGFCHCHDDWYGTDCARRRASAPETTSRPLPQHLTQVLKLPPAAEVKDAATAAKAPKRKRPFIYVYDLPPAYNARMLQYRVERTSCVWRMWGDNNHTDWTGWTYGIETLMHEMLLQSEHRTFDPEEADYFYVPIYSSCFIFPIHCWADGPWWHSPSGPRVMHVTNMMFEALGWMRKNFPYWDRRKGRDHIWLMSHDEGACYAPTEIYKTSIFLTHWGRMDLNHKSNTAFTPDNYTQEWEDEFQTPKKGWLHLIQGHPCFTPGKDLVIPAFKPPYHFKNSPLLGALPTKERPILMYFRGDVGKGGRLPHYSRGIRQRLFNLSVEQEWKKKYNILLGGGEDVPGDYSGSLASSKFCLVAPGDGWSPRMEDAVLHGCIPVIIMDEVQVVWESIIDVKSFSIRIPESDLERVPHVLKAVPEGQLKKMQRALRRVWHRYAYTAHPFLHRAADSVTSDNLRERRGEAQGGGGGTEDEEDAAWSRPSSQYRFPHDDDAFHTIIRWLHSRMKDIQSGKA